MIFEPGDIVRAPFPHVERPVLVPRPALVVTAVPIGPDGLLLWALMITNAARPAWPGDIDIPDASALGLLIPSKIRTAKIAAIETATATHIVRLDARTMERVAEQLRFNLGF